MDADLGLLLTAVYVTADRRWPTCGRRSHWLDRGAVVPGVRNIRSCIPSDALSTLDVLGVGRSPGPSSPAWSGQRGRSCRRHKMPSFEQESLRFLG